MSLLEKRLFAQVLYLHSQALFGRSKLIPGLFLGHVHQLCHSPQTLCTQQTHSQGPRCSAALPQGHREAILWECLKKFRWGFGWYVFHVLTLCSHLHLSCSLFFFPSPLSGVLQFFQPVLECNSRTQWALLESCCEKAPSCRRKPQAGHYKGLQQIVKLHTRAPLCACSIEANCHPTMSQPLCRNVCTNLREGWPGHSYNKYLPIR